MKRYIIRLTLITSAFILTGLSLCIPLTHAAFNRNLIMDDAVFNDSGSMSAASINNWLNVNFPSSCISTNNGFSSPDPIGYNPSQGYLYGGNVSGGQVIYDAARAYDINPQVLIATLQKESSVVSGDASYHCQYINTAMGYGCPDSGSCPTDPATMSGFSKQVIHAAWLFKFGQQRSEGNTGFNVQKPGWDNSDDPGTCYGGPMTQGTLSRGCGQPAAYYDGYTTIDGTSVHMDTGPTAAFYWYTPHFSGNQNFYNIFTAWFGGTVTASYYSCHDGTNVAGIGTGEQIVRNRVVTRDPDKLSLVIPNNTSSRCVEVHTWLNNNYDVWLQHTATNSPPIDPRFSNIRSAITSSAGTSNLYVINYIYTSSGMVEIHGWDQAEGHWISHVATNRPAINPNDAEVVAADTNGDGIDEFYLVQYRNTSSGMVEIHGWSANLQQWTSHIATNLPAIDPAQGKIITADLDGNGKDEFVYVKFAGTQSGMTEVHVWTPGGRNWAAHIATNLPTSGYIDGNDDVIAAARYGNGNQTDQLLFVKMSSTGSGLLEVHGWTPNLQQWSSHTATSQGSF